MDNDMVTGLTFVDFRKAFDVINHEPRALTQEAVDLWGK